MYGQNSQSNIFSQCGQVSFCLCGITRGWQNSLAHVVSAYPATGLPFVQSKLTLQVEWPCMWGILQCYEGTKKIQILHHFAFGINCTPETHTINHATRMKNCQIICIITFTGAFKFNDSLPILFIQKFPSSCMQRKGLSTADPKSNQGPYDPGAFK